MVRFDLAPLGDSPGNVTTPLAAPAISSLLDTLSRVARMGSWLIFRNFNKFLVDREGKLAGRFGSGTKPEALKSEIEKVL